MPDRRPTCRTTLIQTGPPLKYSLRRVSVESYQIGAYPKAIRDRWRDGGYAQQVQQAKWRQCLCRRALHLSIQNDKSSRPSDRQKTGRRPALRMGHRTGGFHGEGNRGGRHSGGRGSGTQYVTGPQFRSASAPSTSRPLTSIRVPVADLITFQRNSMEGMPTVSTKSDNLFHRHESGLHCQAIVLPRWTTYRARMTRPIVPQYHRPVVASSGRYGNHTRNARRCREGPRGDGW